MNSISFNSPAYVPSNFRTLPPFLDKTPQTAVPMPKPVGEQGLPKGFPNASLKDFTPYITGDLLNQSPPSKLNNQFAQSGIRNADGSPIFKTVPPKDAAPTVRTEAELKALNPAFDIGNSGYGGVNSPIKQFVDTPFTKVLNDQIVTTRPTSLGSGIVIPTGSTVANEWGKIPSYSGPRYDGGRAPAIVFTTPSGDSVELSSAQDRTTGTRATRITVSSASNPALADKPVFVIGSVFFNPNTGEVSAVTKKIGNEDKYSQRDLMSTVNTVSERNGVLGNVADVVRYLKGLK